MPQPSRLASAAGINAEHCRYCACILILRALYIRTVLCSLSFFKFYLLVCFIFLLCLIFSYGLSCFVKYIFGSISFRKIVCVFDVQVIVYTCAPLSDEFETMDRKPGFGRQNQFCVALRSVLFLQKTLSNGDDDRIGFFDFFTIEKREPLQHVFLCVAPQSTINRISTSTPRSTLHYHFIQTPLLCHTTYQCRTHITILQSIINPITRYRSYTKSHFTQHHFHIDFTPHRQHSSVAPLP